MNKPIIFIDLDETLIHSAGEAWNGWEQDEYLQGRGYQLVPRGEENPHHLDEKDCRLSSLRPTAKELLEKCRELSGGQTKLLTSATRSYAKAHVRKFHLEFEDQDIFAREDCVDMLENNKTLGEVLGTDKQTSFWLIDNQLWESEGLEHKRKLLGIDQAHFFQIRPFLGTESNPQKLENDPDRGMSVQNIIEALENRLKEKHKPKSKALPENPSLEFSPDGR
jgi:hypothetical protein